VACPWSCVDSRDNGSHAIDTSRQELLTAFNFDERHMQAITLATEGGNIFKTGVAGTGQSRVTERIIFDARALARRTGCGKPGRQHEFGGGDGPPKRPRA
jgi:hypothetical protein